MVEKAATSQKKYNDFLSSYLDEKLYETAANLNIALVEKFSVTDTYARKIISRAVDQQIILSSHPYTFGKGQYLYLSLKASLDIHIIMKATKKNRPPIYRLLSLLFRNEGIVSYYEALKITASPLEQGSTKMDSLNDIIHLLKKLELIIEKKDLNGVVYILLKNEQSTDEAFQQISMNSHYSKMVLDCSILPDIMRWLTRTNLIDNVSFLYRNKTTPQRGVKHNNLVWDAIAYTRTTGINSVLGAKANTLEKQTLVVLDVVLSDEYSQIHFDAFMSRIQVHRNSVKGTNRKIMPIIVYKNSSAMVLNIIRKNGILTYDVATIFGKRIYEVIESYHDLFKGIKVDTNVDQHIEKILSKIRDSGQEDALRELRGTLFEFLMYPVLSTIYPNSQIDRGRKIARTDEKTGKKLTYEYDYIINSRNPNELVFVELKGYNAGATIPLGDSETKASLRWFFRKTLPIAVEENKQLLINDKKYKALFITSAQFWEDGHEFIKKLNKGKLKSMQLETGYERSSLIELLRKYDFTNEIQVLEKFYSNPNDDTSDEDDT